MPMLAEMEMDIPSIPGMWKGGFSTSWTRSAIASGPPGEGHPVRQDHELVPAEASDRVARPQDADQPTGDHLEQLVAGAVPERVVGVLEVVQVDEEGRHRARRSAGPAPASDRRDRGSAGGSPGR